MAEIVVAVMIFMSSQITKLVRNLKLKFYIKEKGLVGSILIRNDHCMKLMNVVFLPMENLVEKNMLVKPYVWTAEKICVKKLGTKNGMKNSFFE
jgi:hypothetical protein